MTFSVPRVLSAATTVSGYTAEEAKHKNDIHVAGAKLMKCIAKELGLTAKDFDIRSNKAGPAVSGEVTLHTDKLYVQMYEGNTSNGPGLVLLYRTCKGRKDYCGGPNQYQTIEALASTTSKDYFLGRLQQMQRMA